MPARDEKKKGLAGFFQNLMTRAATMDPTGTGLEMLGVRQTVDPEQEAMRKMLTPQEFNYTDPNADPLAEMMNRQGRIKKTFGKIPGR